MLIKIIFIKYLYKEALLFSFFQINGVIIIKIIIILYTYMSFDFHIYFYFSA